MRSRFGLMLLAATCGCSLLDSVDGYEGPGSSAGTAGSVAPSGAGGGAGSGGGAVGSTGGWATGGAPSGGTGGCSSAAECGDQNPCNGEETCSAAEQCEPGVPPKVDDGNSCTTDYCDSSKGVQHVMGTYPPVKQCIATTDVCPADYYRAEFWCCDPQCGPCPYYVNAQICERACASEIKICCGDLESKCTGIGCPSGYTKSGAVAANCLCGAAGFAVVCKR